MVFRKTVGTFLFSIGIFLFFLIVNFLVWLLWVTNLKQSWRQDHNFPDSFVRVSFKNKEDAFFCSPYLQSFKIQSENLISISIHIFNFEKFEWKSKINLKYLFSIFLSTLSRFFHADRDSSFQINHESSRYKWYNIETPWLFL